MDGACPNNETCTLLTGPFRGTLYGRKKHGFHLPSRIFLGKVYVMSFGTVVRSSSLPSGIKPRDSGQILRELAEWLDQKKSPNWKKYGQYARAPPKNMTFLTVPAGAKDFTSCSGIYGSKFFPVAVHQLMAKHRNSLFTDVFFSSARQTSGTFQCVAEEGPEFSFAGGLCH